MYDYSKLRGHIPDSVYDQLAAITIIDGPRRMSNFLGQCSVESEGFTATVENLNYSAGALMRTWPKRFPTMDIANRYARQPEKIGDYVYSGRMGNSDTEGYKFRGRGYIQLTGKSNYQAFGDSIHVDLVSHPDLVATTYPLASAAFFFTTNSLWAICDHGVDVPTITTLTEHINGGTLHLNERIQATVGFYKILTS